MRAVDPLRTRREFLALTALGVLAGCGTVGPRSRARTPGSALAPSLNPSPSPAPSPAPSPTSAATDGALPHTTRWQASSGDVEPGVKVTAVRYVERLGTDATHRIQVIEAQYGGLLSDAASVLVVSRSWALHDGRVVQAGQTFDVRLVRRGPTWVVTAVHPSEPGPPLAAPRGAARHVLASPRIVLPPAARADVRSGQVHDSVLEAMLRMSRRWVVGVSVVRSGHPLDVFGTTRPSDHPRGRAFDTWQIDGHAVVSPATPRSLVIAYMEALATLGSYNVGGPVLLGSAPQFFSDQTHHDHVHAGFIG